MIGYAVIVLVFLLGLLLKNYVLWLKSLPPGPWGLPFLGSLPFIGKRSYETFARWSKQFGPIVSVGLGPRTMIVLNTYKSFQEAFIKKSDYFNHRPPISLLRIEVKGLGLLNNEGPLWKEHRRFTVMCLKNCGFGKQPIENHILDEICDFANDMEKFGGRPFNPRDCITISVANVVWSVVAGHRFSRNDPKLLELADLNDTIVHTLGNIGILTFFPQLRIIMREKFNKFSCSMQKLREFLQSEIDNHRNNMCEADDHGGDLVSEYLKKGQEQYESGVNTTFTDEQIRAVLLDLFVAGVETTVTTLRWAFLLLMEHPEVQVHMQEEIDNVIGAGRLPANNDRIQMPYTEATLAEIQRYSTVIPTIIHCTPDETELSGYRIPKHTRVLGNIWSLHRDPDVWENPDDFDVNHFLDHNGRFKKVESFLPFGIGKRSCLGESLARMELFLFLTYLLQRFTFRKVEGVKYSVKPIMGLVISPKSFEMCFEPRKKNTKE